MGIFSEIKKSFNEGRNRATKEAKERRNRNAGIELVEQSYGQVLTFRIISDYSIRHRYVEKLVALANVLNAEVTVADRIVTITCPDISTAEMVKETLKS